MREKENKKMEEKKRQLEQLMVKREADALFKDNEEVKRQKRYEENKDLQAILQHQTVSFKSKDEHNKKM